MYRFLDECVRINGDKNFLPHVSQCKTSLAWLLSLVWEIMTFSATTKQSRTFLPFIRTTEPLNEIYRVIFIECDIRDPHIRNSHYVHFVRIRLTLRRCKRIYTTVMCAVTQSLLSRALFSLFMRRCESRSDKRRDWREQSEKKRANKANAHRRRGWHQEKWTAFRPTFTHTH